MGDQWEAVPAHSLGQVMALLWVSFTPPGTPPQETDALSPTSGIQPPLVASDSLGISPYRKHLIKGFLPQIILSLRKFPK